MYLILTKFKFILIVNYFEMFMFMICIERLYKIKFIIIIKKKMYVILNRVLKILKIFF